VNPPSVEAFNRALYVEHLDEVASLRALREALAATEDGDTGLAGVEARLEAHVDALLVGGAPALRVCREAAASSTEPDAAFALAFVACRALDATLLARVRAQAAEPAAVRAVAQALRLALPEAWAEFLVRAIATAAPPWPAVLLDVAAQRRVACAPQAIAALAYAPREALRALGRTAAADALPPVLERRADPDPGARLEAMIAALRLGDRRSLGFVLDRAPHDPIAQLVLGLGGGPEAVPVLGAAASSEPGSLQAIAALGLLGDGVAWSTLLGLLGRPTGADAAARALWLIAGGGPRIEVLVPDVVDPDALTAEERRAWEADGVAPRRADGSPFGTRAIVPATDAAAWRRWAQANGIAPEAGRRLRWGRPYTPASALDALAAASFHPQLRRLAVDEFSIRFGFDASLDPDGLVADRLRRIASLRARTASLELEPGGWPFAGRDIGVRA